MSSNGPNAAIASQTDAAYEQCLCIALASVIRDCGFQCCNGRSFRVLQTALEHFLLRVGQATRAYSEAAGRTQPVLGDATMALVDYGVTVSALIDFARQSGSRTTAAAGGAPAGGGTGAVIPAVFGHDWLAEAALKRPPAATSTTATSDRKPASGSGAAAALTATRPSHVPEHLPPYPRPHTFVSTPALRPRGDDFEGSRKRGAENRRMAELSLTRFLAATGMGAPHSLFQGDCSTGSDPYKLTANELSPRPYVAALMAATGTSGGSSDPLEDPQSEGVNNISSNSGVGGVVVRSPKRARLSLSRQNHPNPFMRPAKFPL